ncbi:MAG: cell division protein SepF [Propioniciclava sp.]|uniref:cell division protein SepF n=1 Tax=Propioniciclava sp. TaxID=2038686 RepID=UPI0039E475FA
MAEGFKKAAVWLGLMADAPYADEDRDGEPTEAVERIERPAERADRPERTSAAVPATVDASVTTLEQRRPAPVPRAADLSRIITVHPRTYNEARTIGEHFRDGTPVIMNLTDMEDADAKRLVDFAAGLIFGLHGSIDRITSKVFLLSPADITVTAEDKERLAGGFFNQS